MVSRSTGLAQTIAVGAVLGATYLGNTYQSVNSLPNILYYQLLAGSLFTSILVPSLVHHVDQDDPEATERVAGGFFGVMLVAAAGLAVLLVVTGPLIMRLLTLGVSEPAVAAAQSQVGTVLLILFVPQILMYLIAGVGGAAMNANGRFALPAGAPALENVGMILTLIAVAAVFGTGIEVGNVPHAEVLLLGIGTTAAVGLHAATVWLGARSCGITLVPRAGWNDPEVRALLRRVVPTLGFTGLEAVQIFAIFVVADRVRGGLVAFQLALSFFFLPIAIITWPVVRALLPQLSRLYHGGDEQGFHDELERGTALTLFITMPAAVAYAALAIPMARAMAFGQLDSPQGIRMVALSLATLAPGVIGESWFILGAYGFYARMDVRAPLRSMAVRVGVSAACMVPAWLVRGPQVLPWLGLSLSAGSLAGGAHVWWRLKQQLPPTHRNIGASARRSVAASLLMIAAAAVVARVFGMLPPTHASEILALLAAAVVGATTYFAVQSRWRSPEIGWLKTGLAGQERVEEEAAAR